MIDHISASLLARRVSLRFGASAQLDDAPHARSVSDASAELARTRHARWGFTAIPLLTGRPSLRPEGLDDWSEPSEWHGVVQHELEHACALARTQGAALALAQVEVTAPR